MRQMRKSPGFVAVDVLTLTLGVGATTAIFTFVYSTMFKSLPYPQADRIIRVYDSGSRENRQADWLGFCVSLYERAQPLAGKHRLYYFD